jgi:hypothetical protein
MESLRRRSIIGGICIVGLTAVGCVQVPLWAPEINVVSSVKPGCDGTEVHAFRVDVTDKILIKEGATPAQPTRGENTEGYELTRIPLTAKAAVPRQVGVSCAYGWQYVGFFNYPIACTSHSVAVRLYRPGYETVELKPGQAPDEVVWNEAADLAAQEQAIDDLLGVSLLATKESRSANQQRRLEPGTKSAAHRQALLFGVREYERLAQAVPDDDGDGREIQARLLAKARRLRTLADGKEKATP